MFLMEHFEKLNCRWFGRARELEVDRMLAGRFDRI